MCFIRCEPRIAAASLRFTETRHTEDTKMRNTLSLLHKALLLPVLAVGCGLHAFAAGSAVTLIRTDAGFTLANGILTVKIDAQSAAILSIAYKGTDMLGVGDRGNGYWSMPGTQLHF